MEINIKEIFESDLDPNSSAWWSADKIDKINYNFNQIGPEGVRGPQGYIGDDGVLGTTGVQGVSGVQGAQGPTGITGIPGINYWESDGPVGTPPGSEYLFPKEHPTSLIQYTSPAIHIGIYNTDTEWTNPVGIYDSVVSSKVKPSAFSEINLRLQSDEDAATHYADMALGGANGSEVLKIGKLNADPGLKLTHEANLIDNKASDTSTTYKSVHQIGQIGSKAMVSVNIQRPAMFNGNLIYNPTGSNNLMGRIIKSNDNIGKTSYTPPRLLVPSFPIGSIISINRDIFESGLFFYLDEQIVQDLSTLPRLDMRWGAGIEIGPYKGWYLCNGKRWRNPLLPPATIPPNDVNNTPDLNGFDYQIESNYNGIYGDQPFTAKIGNGNIMIGGYPMEVQAIQSSGPGRYDIELAPISKYLNLGDGGGVSTRDMEVTSMVHIIYLGEAGMVWNDPPL